MYAARERVCTFYQDGSFDPDQEEQLLSPEDKETDDTSQLFSQDTSRDRRRGALLESRTSNILASLGDDLRKLSLNDQRISNKPVFDAEPFGNFIKWTAEPSLPGKYTGSIEMPAREVQLNLIDIFFQHYYEVVPIIPKSYFYQQLQCKGPLITPLLLNAIYGQASRFSALPNVPRADVFFHRAKRLLDDFMDVPRISTVAALCFMSLYEAEPMNHRPGGQHCRSWMYSGMAYRMCIELGCHNEANMSRDLRPEDIELRRRAFWCCFCLDKFQSAGWERPFMISSTIARVDYPTLLVADENDRNEREIVLAIHSNVELLRLFEEKLTRDATGSCRPDPGGLELLYEKLASWLQALPLCLQWTPLSNVSNDDIMRLPIPYPRVALLHLYYNVYVLDILLRMSNNAYVQSQRQTTATCITQLVYGMITRPAAIIKFDFLAHALITAIKIHAMHLHDTDFCAARHAWSMYDRTVVALKKLQQYAIIPNCSKFLQQLEEIDGRSSAQRMIQDCSQELLQQQHPVQYQRKVDSTTYPVLMQERLSSSSPSPSPSSVSFVNDSDVSQQPLHHNVSSSIHWFVNQPDWGPLSVKDGPSAAIDFAQDCYEIHPASSQNQTKKTHGQNIRPLQNL
ncbi:hypothetical protein DFQ28_002204 [Apophysomyces sp. BC1034]|nr:hypothetical protein DFQ29_001598 [Apophysomyces sp. BC1021]KAG0190319.1 hypothetical protein DFQ28_002204 [Apophysomyces sp. BC1034]